MRRSDRFLFVLLTLTALAATGEALTSRMMRSAVSRPIALSVQCSFGKHALTISYSLAPGE